MGLFDRLKKDKKSTPNSDLGNMNYNQKEEELPKQGSGTVVLDEADFEKDDEPEGGTQVLTPEDDFEDQDDDFQKNVREEDENPVGGTQVLAPEDNFEDQDDDFQKQESNPDYQDQGEVPEGGTQVLTPEEETELGNENSNPIQDGIKSSSPLPDDNFNPSDDNYVAGTETTILNDNDAEEEPDEYEQEEEKLVEQQHNSVSSTDSGVRDTQEQQHVMDEATLDRERQRLYKEKQELRELQARKKHLEEIQKKQEQEEAELALQKEKEKLLLDRQQRIEEEDRARKAKQVLLEREQQVDEQVQENLPDFNEVDTKENDEKLDDSISKSVKSAQMDIIYNHTSHYGQRTESIATDKKDQKELGDGHEVVSVLLKKLHKNPDSVKLKEYDDSETAALYYSKAEEENNMSDEDEFMNKISESEQSEQLQQNQFGRSRGTANLDRDLNPAEKHNRDQNGNLTAFVKKSNKASRPVHATTTFGATKNINTQKQPRQIKKSNVDHYNFGSQGNTATSESFFSKYKYYIVGAIIILVVGFLAFGR